MLMKKPTAVSLVVAGMLLISCNPFEISKPLETNAAVTEAADESVSSDPVLTEDGYQSYLDVTAIPFTEPPDGLHSYQTTEFWFNGLTWYLEIWTDAKPNADGWYDWDDQNRFYIRTYNDYSDGQFILMNERVPIGYPSVDIYDDGKWLHIIISDFRTASAKITDYSYLSEENFFSKTVVLEQYGINYMSGIDVK